jgi:hypothetical protein
LATECFLGAGFVNPAGGLYKARPQRHSYLPGELFGLDTLEKKARGGDALAKKLPQVLEPAGGMGYPVMCLCD